MIFIIYAEIKIKKQTLLYDIFHCESSPNKHEEGIY